MNIRVILLSLGLLCLYAPGLPQAQAAPPVHAPGRAGQETASISANEASALLTLRYLLAAEATYQATAGNGRYGTLLELYRASLIDAKLRSGVSDGYRFTLTVSNPTSAPATFEATARPLVYLETGVRTLTLGETGSLKDSYRQNPTPGEMRAVTDECPSITCTEAFAATSLRTIHSAQATFQATAGAGRYGTLEELAAARLIPEALARGFINGYTYRVRVDSGGAGEPPSYEATATPLGYVRTGIRSFYMDETGILRAGDKQGAEAGAGAPALCF